MPNNKLARISSLPESRSTERAIREWLVKFAELYRKNGTPYTLTPAMVAMWIDSLTGLDVDVFDAACRDFVKEGCRREFPVPSDVRARIDDANSKGAQLSAEEQWAKALHVATDFYHPDLGLYRNAPKLSPATWHALKVAGGLSHLFNCSREDLQWARKRFIDDFALIHETGEHQHLLSDGEAKGILAKLCAGLPPTKPRRLAPAVEATDSKPSCEEVREVLNRVIEIKPVLSQEPSQANLAAKWQQQKEQARQWAVDHGMEPALGQADSAGHKPAPFRNR